MDWLSVDYCSEIRDYIINFIAQERRRVQEEINDVPNRISEKVRRNGEQMQKLINAFGARINTLA